MNTLLVTPAASTHASSSRNTSEGEASTRPAALDAMYGAAAGERTGRPSDETDATLAARRSAAAGGSVAVQAERRDGGGEGDTRRRAWEASVEEREGGPMTARSLALVVWGAEQLSLDIPATWRMSLAALVRTEGLDSTAGAAAADDRGEHRDDEGTTSLDGPRSREKIGYDSSFEGRPTARERPGTIGRLNQGSRGSSRGT